MTNEHTAALKRALDSVRNAREILVSITTGHWTLPAASYSLDGVERLLSVAIDEESKG